MPSIKYPLTVEMEDGTEHKVTADQRDVAEWEIQPFGTSGTELSQRAYTAFRFLAFSALRRKEILAKGTTWAKFNRECIEVGFDNDETEAAVDPTQPDRPADN
jgi:hypothetical protein